MANESGKSSTQPTGLSWAQRLKTGSSTVSTEKVSAQARDTATKVSPSLQDFVSNDASDADLANLSTSQKTASLNGSLPSSSSSSNHATSVGTNLHDQELDDHPSSTAASSLLDDLEDTSNEQNVDQSLNARVAATKITPPVNVWQVRRQQMTESKVSQQSYGATNDADSHARASTFPQISNNFSAESSAKQGAASLHNQAGVPTRRTRNASQPVFSLSDEADWPSPFEERAAVRESSQSRRQVSEQSDGRSEPAEKKKTKWISIPVDITVKAPGKRTHAAFDQRHRLPGEGPNDRKGKQSARADAEHKTTSQITQSAQSTQVLDPLRPAFTPTDNQQSEEMSAASSRLSLPAKPNASPSQILKPQLTLDGHPAMSMAQEAAMISGPNSYAAVRHNDAGPANGPIVSPRMTARQTVEVIEEGASRSRQSHFSPVAPFFTPVYNNDPRRDYSGSQTRRGRGKTPMRGGFASSRGNYTNGYAASRSARSANGDGSSSPHFGPLSAFGSPTFDEAPLPYPPNYTVGADGFYPNDFQQPFYGYYPPVYPHPSQPFARYEAAPTYSDRPHPARPDLLINPTLDEVSYWVLGQVEFYLSVDNLARDTFLREQMDKQGWIPTPMIASFKKIKGLTQDVGLIDAALSRSTILESRNGHVRRRQDWPKYIFPNAKDSTVEAANITVPTASGSKDDTANKTE